MIVKDTQPFSIVEDIGFRTFVSELDPSYIIPTRQEWGITTKVPCMVTDGAPNMVACMRELKLRHHICIAHTLNLVVRKTLDQHPVLSGIRAKARKLVGYFRSCTTPKEKLTQVQHHLGLENLKLIQEVETKWNSTYASAFGGAKGGSGSSISWPAT